MLYIVKKHPYMIFFIPSFIRVKKKIYKKCAKWDENLINKVINLI